MLKSGRISTMLALSITATRFLPGRGIPMFCCPPDPNTERCLHPLTARLIRFFTAPAARVFAPRTCSGGRSEI